MQKILDELFLQQNVSRNKYPAEIRRVNCNKGMLKKDFNKWQKKLLLRIEDDKDLIAEKWAADSFAQGVRYGVMFMFEIILEV